LSDNGYSSQELPRNISAVGSNAKILDATNNRLKEIGNLESLVNLQRLILARNQISELPASIAALQNLKASSAPRSHPSLCKSKQCMKMKLTTIYFPAGKCVMCLFL